MRKIFNFIKNLSVPPPRTLLRKENKTIKEERITSPRLIHTDRFIIMIYWLIFVAFIAEMHEHKRKKKDFYRDHNKQSSMNFFLLSSICHPAHTISQEIDGKQLRIQM